MADEAAVLINLWKVKDGSQEEFRALLGELIAELTAMDEFVEAQIYEGVDGDSLITHVRMGSAAAADDAVESPAVRAVARKLSGLASSQLHRYRLVRSFDRGGQAPAA